MRSESSDSLKDEMKYVYLYFDLCLNRSEYKENRMFMVR